MNQLSAVYKCYHHGKIEVKYLAEQVKGTGFPTQLSCPACPSGTMSLLTSTVTSTVGGQSTL